MVRRISRRGVASSKRSLASREETSRHAAMRPRSAKKGGARYARGEEAEVSDVGAFPRLARDALRVPSLGAPWHLGDLARGLLLPRIDEATPRPEMRRIMRPGPVQLRCASENV